MTIRNLLVRNLRQRTYHGGSGGVGGMIRPVAIHKFGGGRYPQQGKSWRFINRRSYITNGNHNHNKTASSSLSTSSSSRFLDMMQNNDRQQLQQQISPLQLQFPLKSSPSSSSFINDDIDYLSSILSEWFAKIPKGFENFYPKNKKNDDDENSDSNKNENNKETTTTTKEGSKKTTTTETTNPSFQSKNDNANDFKNRGSSGGGGGGGIPPDGGDPPTIPALLALLLLVMGARRLLEEGQEGGGGYNGKEITFVDFRNHLLHSGQVDKIVVVNNKMARVVLHPGSRGIPSTKSAHSSLSTPAGLSTNTSNADGGGGSSVGGDNDTTVMEFDKATDSSAVGAGGVSSSTLSSSGSGHHGSNNTPVYHFYIGSIESFEEKLSKAQNNIHPREWVPVQYVSEINVLVEFIKATPMLAMLAMLAYWSRGFMASGGMGGPGGGGGGPGGIFQIGKSNAKKINPESVKVNFNDVAGCEQAKLEIMEFVDFLKDSSRFTKLGAKIPKGALLCGPPGTGKTLLAKAVAGEAGVPFYSISGSDFIEMFVGVGPSRVRDLFKEARANSPCIVFIDEIDAVGRQRGRGGFSGGNDERENTLNQLLVEMDGFTTTTGIVVLAGTNRVDILDQALTRPGRFDRQVQVDRPDLMGRKDIFNVHLQGLTLDGPAEEFAGRLAGLTPGFAGADIANLCNEAAIVAARRAADSVTIDDFEEATDRIIGGLASNKIMSEEEQEIVAHHEAGHAVAGWFLEHADPLLKVTIIPRSSGALGYAQYLPKEVFLRTQEQIMDIVCMALAGRAAEEVFFGRVTTGASDDLKRVTQLVYSTIQTYGMNSKIGQLVYPQDDGGMPGDKPYSEATAEAMDEEARAIVDAAYARTVELIREKKTEVEQVAKLLIEKETITHDDMVDLVGERPFEGDDQYKEYVSAKYNRRPPEEGKEEKKSSEEDELTSADNEGGLTPGLA